MMLPRATERDFAIWPDAGTVLSAVTEGGAAALGLNGQVGRIAPGLLADLILVRANAAGTIGAPSIATLVQHAGPEHVRSVMVDGRWLMRDGQITVFDEATMLAEAAAYADRLRLAVAPQVATLRNSMPNLTAGFIAACG